ncbi:hypothetical protein EC973_009269 [Apophysomyces ossiformis]|uniref:polynucleotide adenylyltransferase n=1 Tax=Apophysomyces ossiformis TaxID=679940 RepID=A0A8H7BYJ2_9FUNG|nr:hypothetical protein EC973_009269 [Apophysomyces ossiformis]
MGYLNGSTWTLLLLKTYMDTKTRPLTIHMLLRAFFEQWSGWHWQTPVIIGDFIPDFGGGVVAYSSLKEFENAVMPIVSPCYPVCSTAPYVTKSTLRIMRKELSRAVTIVQVPDLSTDEKLQRLFKPLDFAKTYKHFLKIIISCDTYGSHETWKMASYIPRFVPLLETCPELKQVHPLTTPYSKIYQYRTREEKVALRNGLESGVSPYATALEPGTLYLTHYVIGLEIELLDESDRVIDLSKHIQAFMAELDLRKNKRDNDVYIEIVAVKRRELANILKDEVK